MNFGCLGTVRGAAVAEQPPWSPGEGVCLHTLYLERYICMYGRKFMLVSAEQLSRHIRCSIL